jgi:UDP-N-acetylmuramoyl-L-alanyl-D-glutamate--2,6-diaminopimelate ligase
MNLQTLLADDAVPALELSGLSEHTAETEQGYAFIGVAANDAVLSEHCLAAVARGAVAILCDRQATSSQWLSKHIDVPIVQVSDLARLRGALAAKFYADPSADQMCIGVTGTNGKTSVAFHLADMSTRLGVPMGYSGTLGWGCLDDLQGGDMTTGNPVALQRQLADMRDRGMTAVALEVSSHALAQNRAEAIHFDVAIFTNLSRDHLDYHGSLEAYAAAKEKLFTKWPLRAAVINVDDEFGIDLAARCEAAIVTYGRQGHWRWQTHQQDNGLHVTWQTPSARYEIQLPVVADYAIANITAAMATLVTMGHSYDDVFASLDGLRWVPGRMEVIGAAAQRPTVVVDYAHTPDALTKVLAALRPFCQGKLVCVVGCGGDRDVGKRPLMGAAAVAGADLVWLTSDNPRSEEPAAIIADMRQGTQAGAVFECLDRAEAIRQAVGQAEPLDVVLVAGKGHEAFQEVDGQYLPFDDRQVVADVLQELG